MSQLLWFMILQYIETDCGTEIWYIKPTCPCYIDKKAIFYITQKPSQWYISGSENPFWVFKIYKDIYTGQVSRVSYYHLIYLYTCVQDALLHYTGRATHYSDYNTIYCNHLRSKKFHNFHRSISNHKPFPVKQP